jgi:hypothetical protein
MDSAMTPDETLLHETRLRPRQAIIAGLAALLLVLAAVVQVIGPQAHVSELTVQLLLINKRFPLDIIGSVLQGAGLLALVWTLAFLFDAAKARRPEMQPVTRYVALTGGIVSAIGGVIYAVLLAVKAHQFATTGAQTYQQANSLTKGAALPILQTLDIAAQFALEIGLILIALNAMRVGLLTRFLGYTGIVVGIAGMLLIGSAPAAAIQVFWMGAIAYLLAGRWPGGDPPAWRTGQAEPWPSTASMREERLKEAGQGGRGSSRKQPAPPQPAPEAVGASGSSAGAARTRASTPKRKRKRRR